MTYILLVAGKGTRLHPLTTSYPKCLYKLDENTTTINRMVNLIKENDKDAEIVLVTGFMEDVIKQKVGDDVIYIFNPFYSVTNSIASLWFAREYLNREQVAIINGDIVMSEKAIKEILCTKQDKPLVLLDSSVKSDGDYNVQVNGEYVVVMSKNLKNYFGEYVGITMLNHTICKQLLSVLDKMIAEEQFDAWYEDVVVRMIFRDSKSFFYFDVCDYEWTEIDDVDDLLKAKEIHNSSK